jgi:hypothetical protein
MRTRGWIRPVLRVRGQSRPGSPEAAARGQVAEPHWSDRPGGNLQYLEALKELGVAESTKFVIPIEFVSLMGRTGEAFATDQS